MIDSGGIKLHIFMPSERKIWTIIGKFDEHWVDPDLEFCSCKSYYFKTLSEGEICYHLSNVEYAIKENKYIKIQFDDSEFMGFFKALITDIANRYVRNS